MPSNSLCIGLWMMKSKSVSKLHVLDLMRLLLTTVCCDWERMLVNVWARSKSGLAFSLHIAMQHTLAVMALPIMLLTNANS